MIDYICPTCRARHAVTLDRFRCDCGAPLSLDFEAAAIDREALSRRPLSIWRYREALPLAEDLAPASLGAGVAPLVDDTLGGIPVHLALEYVSPTGSFKDRGASLLVAVAAALGAPLLVDDTSGNAGIALAAHAARAGLKARVLVPDDASPAKPRIAAELGAEVVRVPGGRTAAAAAALEEAESGAFYASHALSPFFLHGTKTAAYSIAEALRWTAPGAVIVPVGNGGLALGLDLGFREMRRHGLIDRRPAIVGVQAAACAPLRHAFEAGATSPSPLVEAGTVADGVRVSSPPRGADILAAVRESGGSVEAVTEGEIEEARRRLWRRGYAVESTGAVAAALVLRAGDDLRRRHGDLVVALTGSGLKL
jgi:threonine synthase